MSQEKGKDPEKNNKSPKLPEVVGGILKPRSRRSAQAHTSIIAATTNSITSPTTSKKIQIQRKTNRSRYEMAHKCWTFDEILTNAREHFATIAAPEHGCKPGIEEFFEERGFSIKIAHKDLASAGATSSAAAAAAAADIEGLFVINNEEIPISGIVIDAMDNFKVLVMPLPDVVRDENTLKYCLMNSDAFDIYRALDGTRVTLYYVERYKLWLLATTNSYDARAYRWVGPKTYMELLMECLPSGFSLDMLDKTAQYSFIFRHCNFHPLIQDPPHDIWQISGPPMENIKQYAPIPAAERVSGERMRHLARNAFIDFARTRGRPGSDPRAEPNYGYIFRRRGDPATEKNNGPMAAYLESSLHEFVRKRMYDIPTTVVGLNYETRPIFLHLRGYMSLGLNHAHLVMFPQASEIYEKMDFVIELLTDMTVAEMRASSSTIEASIPGDTSTESGSTSPKKERERERRLGYIINAEQSAIGEKIFGTGAWQSIRPFLVQISKSMGTQLIATGKMGKFADHIHANVHDQYLNVINTLEFLKILTMK